MFILLYLAVLFLNVSLRACFKRFMSQSTVLHSNERIKQKKVLSLNQNEVREDVTSACMQFQKVREMLGR